MKLKCVKINTPHCCLGLYPSDRETAEQVFPGFSISEEMPLKNLKAFYIADVLLYPLSVEELIRIAVSEKLYFRFYGNSAVFYLDEFIVGVIQNYHGDDFEGHVVHDRYPYQIRTRSGINIGTAFYSGNIFDLFPEKDFIIKFPVDFNQPSGKTRYWTELNDFDFRGETKEAKARIASCFFNKLFEISTRNSLNITAAAYAGKVIFRITDDVMGVIDECRAIII